MCGITGFFLRGEALPSRLLEEMTLALVHRGPDDQGFLGLPRVTIRSGGRMRLLNRCRYGWGWAFAG